MALGCLCFLGVYFAVEELPDKLREIGVAGFR